MGLVPSLKIAQKLPLAMVGSALLVSAGVGILSFFIGTATVEQMSQRQMQTVATERAKEFRTYLESLQADLVNSASAESVQTSLRDFTIAWGQFSTLQPVVDPITQLRADYIDNNPNPSGQRQALDSMTADKKHNYDFLHSKVHPNFRRQLEARGYSDLYLIDKDGNLLYSVMKQDDFTDNLNDGGKYANSGLGRAYRKAMTFTEPGHVAFEEMSAYLPSGGAPSSFLATPVFDPRKKLIGVMAIQMPIATINRIMQNNANLGETGESFFVGADHLLRNDSVFSSEDDTLKTSYVNAVVDAALGGATASGVTTDYRGMRMFATATPVEFNGAKWAMVTAIGEDEALAPIANMRNMMLALGAGLLVVAAAGGFVFSRSVSKPITRLTGTMGALARGDLEVEVKGAERKDEIGAMAAAVQVFKENALKVQQMTEGERAASQQRRIDRAQMMQQLQAAFGEVVDAAIAGDFSKRVEATFP
jgi:methyl-accepting chemotaxis protein